jgi:Tol biopolymer transport system component
MSDGHDTCGLAKRRPSRRPLPSHSDGLYHRHRVSITLGRGALLALAILLAAAAAGLTRWRSEAGETRRLAWVATAQQFGPVGYRDPVGAISPDGQLIAYSEGRFLRVRPVAGGASLPLAPVAAQIRHLAWRPDSKAMLTDGDTPRNGWVLHELDTAVQQPLLAGRRELSAQLPSGEARTISVRGLRQPAWSPDGRSIAALVDGSDGNELWIVSSADGSSRATRLARRASFPAWTSRGEVACVSTVDGRRRVTLPCDGPALVPNPDRDAYGPLAFAPDATTVYVGLANEEGMLDLWSVPVAGGRATQLSSFTRDSYAPSVASDGSALFKVQSYRTTVAVAAAGGGSTRSLTAFQSETPSWDPAGRQIGITYGTWRRVIDDANYPDIAQDAGIIDVSGPSKPSAARVVDASDSEDQSLCWSPNGKWIAYHSHKEQSDDIWLRPADGSAAGRRISFLGRGAETGWPRWSNDGRWILFDGAEPQSRASTLFVIGVNQDSGEITRPAQAIPVTGLDADISHGEWLPGSEHLIALAKEGPGQHLIFTVPRRGGPARIVHRFATEHDTPGLSISPDGLQVAYVSPAPDGFFQIFAIPIAGGSPRQVTTDLSHKTQPAWSPDGQTIAFTLWSYEAQFWRVLPRNR